MKLRKSGLRLFQTQYLFQKSEKSGILPRTVLYELLEENEDESVKWDGTRNTNILVKYGTTSSINRKTALIVFMYHNVLGRECLPLGNFSERWSLRSNQCGYFKTSPNF